MRQLAFRAAPAPLVVALAVAGAVALAVHPSQAQAPAYLEVRDVPSGTLHEHAYASRSLGTDREMVVYTPPGYESGSERYPVLYLLHGAGSDQTSWTSRGQAHVILDNLIAEGRLAPLVVVMPYGYAFRRQSGAGRGDATENRTQREGFSQDLLNDVIPRVEAGYRVYADREHRAIAGLSLGGAQAIALGIGHTELFSRVAGFSSALGAVLSPEVGGLNWDVVLGDPDPINERLDLLWIGCGTEDTLFGSNQDFASRLAQAGVEHVFRVTRGGHTYDVWQRYLHEVAPLLFPMSSAP
jgi:enterochelin esterase family protein